MKIFLSYSNANHKRAAILLEDLEDMGHDVWFDEELKGGKRWWNRILKNIRESDCFLFILTPEWFADEITGLLVDYALLLGKNLLPVQMSTLNIDSLPEQFADLEIVDYRQRDMASLKILVRAMTLMPPPAALPDPLPEAPLHVLSPLDPIIKNLRKKSLSLQEQHTILADLRKLISEAVEITAARNLLLDLKNHPDADPDVVDGIIELLNLPPIIRPETARNIAQRDTFAGHQDKIHVVKFSPDGCYLAISMN